MITHSKSNDANVSGLFFMILVILLLGENCSGVFNFNLSYLTLKSVEERQKRGKD